MDNNRGCQSSEDCDTITPTHHYLKNLNKLSHKISKPLRKPPLDPPLIAATHFNQPQEAPAPSQQHQPPVYNINKNDFRDVVQKLTGSPAHERFSTPPPPIQPPKPPQTSRLHRIRPPPLAQVSPRPPPLLNTAFNPQHPLLNVSINATVPIGPPPPAPFSPLPPFPTVHAAAESPVSAYMRHLRNSISAVDSNNKQFSGFSPIAPMVSPRWSNLARPPSQPLHFQLPTSPLPFGCLNSPQSPHPLLSPGVLLSSPFPLSPTLPVPSPRRREL